MERKRNRHNIEKEVRGRERKKEERKRERERGRVTTFLLITTVWENVNPLFPLFHFG